MNDSTPITTSKKRKFLAWYIDFLFFLSLWALLEHFIGNRHSIPFWVPYVLFISVRFITTKYLGSIGMTFLGISNEDGTVDQHTWSNETVVTIFLGVISVLEGTKQLVRWTEYFIAQPAFGFLLSEPTQIALQLLYGCIYTLAGYWILKLDIRGLYLGLSVAIINIASDILSWNLWDGVVKDMVIARRSIQGIPVRDGEIEFMQSIMPEGMLVASSLAVLLLIISYKNFRHPIAMD